MTLQNFLRRYDGDDAVSIKGYCEEWRKEEVLTADWYKKIRRMSIDRWLILGGGMYKIEIWIELEQD